MPENTPTQEATARAIAQGMEVVICAAIKWQGRIWRGHRHGHAMEAMRNELCYEMSWREVVCSGGIQEQGFITSKNRYVSRRDARALQDAAGIPSADKDGYRYDTLFSEDLY